MAIIGYELFRLVFSCRVFACSPLPSFYSALSPPLPLNFLPSLHSPPTTTHPPFLPSFFHFSSRAAQVYLQEQRTSFLSENPLVILFSSSAFTSLFASWPYLLVVFFLVLSTLFASYNNPTFFQFFCFLQKQVRTRRSPTLPSC